MVPPSQPVGLERTLQVVNSHPIDMSRLVDGGCRCLSPARVAAGTPHLSMLVHLRNRNVWPASVSIVSSSNHAAELLRLPLERVDPNAVGTTIRVTVPIAAAHAAWRVGPTSVGRDGTLPPWHAVDVLVQRESLLGAPSNTSIPWVEDVTISLGDPASDPFLIDIAPPTHVFNTTLGDWRFGNATVFRGDFAAFASARGVEVGSLQVEVEVHEHTAGTTVAALMFLDERGARATVNVTDDDMASQAANGLVNKTTTLVLPLRSDWVRAQPDFDWSSVAQWTIMTADAVAVNQTTITLSGLRLGWPQRVGHVTSGDDYNTDDMACDPFTGWFKRSPYVRHDIVRYGHCRECCCYFDDPGNPVVKHCYEQGDIISEVTPAPDMAPNDQCAVCNRINNPQVMSPRNQLLPEGAVPPYFPCDDAEPCTWNDRCRDDGACIAELYTTCLVSDFWGGDPSKNCEVCDGTGPSSPTLGCGPAPGHYVFAPHTPGRVCGCSIDGVVYPHMSLHPDYPCLRCDVVVDNEAWTQVPNDSKCNITAQHDWLNLASQSCTYGHICDNGVCVGQPYSCAPLQLCEAPTPEFPNVCDLSGPASATAGCQRRELAAGALCAPQVHGCMPAAECTGIVGSCPPQIELPGIIYEDAAKRVQLKLPNGDPVDAQFAVVPSVETVQATFESFRGQCGDLQLRMGIIPAGSCDVSFVSESLGRGWGRDFAPPPRGSFALLTRGDGSAATGGASNGPVVLTHASRFDRVLLTPGAVGDSTVVPLAANASDLTDALAQGMSMPPVFCVAWCWWSARGRAHAFVCACCCAPQARRYRSRSWTSCCGAGTLPCLPPWSWWIPTTVPWPSHCHRNTWRTSGWWSPVRRRRTACQRTSTGVRWRVCASCTPAIALRWLPCQPRPRCSKFAPCLCEHVPRRRRVRLRTLRRVMEAMMAPPLLLRRRPPGSIRC